jgi:predicted dehydrogenase
MKVGILGAGGIAAKMAHTLNAMNANGEDVTCLAVGSRSLDKAQAFAEKFGIAKAYGSYEDLVADGEIDLIYVATPHSHHYEHGMLALNAGRNILVEKAFTGNAKQARALLNCAAEKGLLAAEAIWTRYMPSRKMLTDLINGGAIGNVTELSANLAYKNEHLSDRMHKPELAGGALLDLGVYVINFALMAFGDDVGNISADAELMASGVDRFEHIHLTFADGKKAELFASLAENSDRKGIIKGDKGWIEFENVNCCEWIEVHGSDGDSNTVTDYPVPQMITGFEYQVRACAKAIAEGKTEVPDMPHAEILRVMEMMDEIRRQIGVVYPFD